MKSPSIAAFRPNQNGIGLKACDVSELLEKPASRALFEMFPQGVIIFSRNGEVLFINRVALQLLSRSEKRPLAPATVSTLSAMADMDMAPLISGQSIGERRLTLRNRSTGSEIPVTVHSFADASGAPALRIAFMLTATVRSEPIQSSFWRDDSFPILQQRLQPLINIGLKAFRAKRRILLLGETGVGKTTLAFQMHRESGPAERPFIHINCSSINENLFESEMFGYERGAFTGALSAGKQGFIEAAAGGTLFLDEIGDMPLSQQVKLLKFLEDGTIQPVGSSRSKSVDVYVVCATNRDLEQDVKARRFRNDLFYRIAMIPIEVPPLRTYSEELPAIIDAMVANLNLIRARRLKLSAECRSLMVAHHYPGNMRELIGLIGRLDVVADDVAEPHHLPSTVRNGNARLGNASDDCEPEGAILKERVRRYERRLIKEALSAHRSKRQAAKALGIDVASLIRKLSAADKASTDPTIA